MVVYSEEFIYKLILSLENPSIENLRGELKIKLSTPEDTDLQNILSRFKHRKKKKQQNIQTYYLDELQIIIFSGDNSKG